MKAMNSKRENLLFAWMVGGFALTTVVIHMLTAYNYELHRDGMLYFAMGDHPSFGYLSTPPLIGWTAFAIRHIAGYSVFAIKLVPALLGAASLITIGFFVREMGGKLLAVFIAEMAYLTSAAFLRSNALFQPVSFDEFFWLLTSFLFLRLINRQDEKIWIWLGVVIGFGFLAKYSITFLVLAWGIALLLSPYRKLLWNRFLLYGTLLGLIIILPNLIWQFEHDWPVVHHMVELQKTQLVNVTLAGFLTSQLLFHFTSLWVWITGLIVLLVARSERKFRPIAVAYIAVLIILILSRGKSYYTLGAYPMLFAAGGYVLEKYLTGVWRWANYALLVVSVLLLIPILPLALPVLPINKMAAYCQSATDFAGPGIITWEDGKVHNIPQDYADMTGWKELAGLTAKAYQSLTPEQQADCRIYAENYGEAAAVHFYGHTWHLPEPISFSDSYLLWAPDSAKNNTLIYINDEVGDIDKLFNNYREIGEIDDVNFRENGLKVFLCTNPRPEFKPFYAAKVNELKSMYRR